MAIEATWNTGKNYQGTWQHFGDVGSYKVGPAGELSFWKHQELPALAELTDPGYPSLVIAPGDWHDLTFEEE